MDDALVVVRTYVNNFPAEVARTALEAAGIDAMIRSDDCGGMRPHLWLGGIELLVRTDDAREAAEILEQPAAVQNGLPAAGGDGET